MTTVKIKSREDLNKLKEGDLVIDTDLGFAVCGVWDNGKKLYTNSISGVLMGYDPYNEGDVNIPGNGLVAFVHDFEMVVGVDEHSQEGRWARHLMRSYIPKCVGWENGR